MVYAEDARAWTEAPSTLRRAVAAAVPLVVRHDAGDLEAPGRDVERGPASRSAAAALPYMVLFQILLPLLAPLIDLFALYGLIFLDPLRGHRLSGCASTPCSRASRAYAFRLDGESLRPLWALPLQQFVYRQLMYLVVVESVISALNGARAAWKTIPRTGDIELPPGTPQVAEPPRALP